jgi:hypothetical protein
VGSPNTAILRGFQIHYNLFRPHETLPIEGSNPRDYMTPAEAAGIYLSFHDGRGILIRWAYIIVPRKGRMKTGIMSRSRRSQRHQSLPVLSSPMVHSAHVETAPNNGSVSGNAFMLER